MGCCGEPANQPGTQERSLATAVGADGNGLITEQPSPQPTPSWQEKATFQPPGIATPPPVFQNGQNAMTQNWNQQGQVIQFNPYGASNGAPPPTASPTLINSSAPATSTTLANSLMYGQGVRGNPSPYGQAQATAPLIQPDPVYSTNMNMTATSRISVSPGGYRPAFSTPSDEGKLSVSIDFGTRLLYFTELPALNSLKVLPSLAW